MIHPDVTIVDLEPDGFAWLCEVVGARLHRPVDEIQVLHRDGRVVAASHRSQGLLDPGHPVCPRGAIVDDPAALAERLRTHEAADRVTLLDAARLGDLTRSLNTLAATGPTQLELLAGATERWWNHPAVVTVPATPRGRTRAVLDALGAQPGQWWAVFGAWRGEDLQVSLLARFEDGVAVHVTSAQAFHVRPQRSDADALVDAVESTAEARIVVLADVDVVEAIVAADDPLVALWDHRDDLLAHRGLERLG